MSRDRWVLRALLTTFLLMGGLRQSVAGQSVDKSPTADGGKRPLIRVEEGVVTADRQGPARSPAYPRTSCLISRGTHVFSVLPHRKEATKFLVRSRGEANAATLTGVDGTDALEGSMDCVGREGREGLGDPGGEMGRAKGLPTGRVVEREGGTAT